MIRHLIGILRDGLESLKKKKGCNEDDIDAAKQQVLESFEKAVSQSLPPLPERKHVEPDKHVGPGELDHEDFAAHGSKKGERDGGKAKGSSSTSKKSKATEKESSKAYKSDSMDTTALPEKVIRVTELDKHIRKLRVQELKALHTDCKMMPIHQMMAKVEEYIERLKKMAKVQLYIQARVAIATSLVSILLCTV